MPEPRYSVALALTERQCARLAEAAQSDPELLDLAESLAATAAEITNARREDPEILSDLTAPADAQPAMLLVHEIDD